MTALALVLSIAVAVLLLGLLGLLVGLALVRIGSWLSPGSASSIRRAYREQRADLRTVLPSRNLTSLNQRKS